MQDGTLDKAQREQLVIHVRDCKSCQLCLADISAIERSAASNAPSEIEPTIVLTNTGETPQTPPDDATASTVAWGDETLDSVAKLVSTNPSLASRGMPQIPGYEITDEIGRGGMGVVYKARHLSLNRVVALKTIRSASLANEQQLARFKTEAEALAQIQHPHIVQVFEIGEIDDTPFLTMEFVAGSTLDETIEAGSFTPMESAQCVEQLARAMFSAHQRGVLHRDLKPSNILLTDDLQPKITDFGLAKCTTNDSQMTVAETIMGTPSYMPPEQAQGRLEEIGPQSDIYSLGAVLYELLTGRPPFRGSTPLETVRQVIGQEVTPPRHLAPKTPRDLETICLKCLHKQPAARYATAADLADDLVRFRRSEPISARRIGFVGRSWRWCQRNRTLTAAMAITCCVIIIGTAAVIWQRQQTEQAREVAQQQYLRFTAEADEKFNLIEDLMQRIPEDALAQDQRLRSALTSYEDWLAEEPTGEAVQASYADALFRVGEIRRRIGQYEQAETIYRRASEHYQRLLTSSPDRSEYRHAWADVLNWLGESYRESGRPQEAITAYDESLAQLTHLDEGATDESQFTVDIARAHYNRALARIDLDDHASAEADLLRSIKLLTGISGETSHEPTVRQSLARSHANLGIVLRATDRSNEAHRHYTVAIDLYRVLIDDAPGEPEYRLESAVASNNIANLLYADVRRNELGIAEPLAEATASFNAAIDILRDLVREFANVPRYRKELANTLNGLGAVKLDNKDATAAAQAWLAAAAEFQSLVERSPAVAEYQALLAQTTFNLAFLSHLQSRAEDRVKYLAEAIALQRQAVSLSPGNSQYQQTLERYEQTADRLNK